MAKVRVHELARSLGMTNREVMDTLKSLGIDVKSHMSSVEDTLAGKVREKYEMIRKEQKVEAPNNEKNINKQEELRRKRKILFGFITHRMPAMAARENKVSAEEETEDRDREDRRIPIVRHRRMHLLREHKRRKP